MSGVKSGMLGFMLFIGFILNVA
eukprot:COSAG06_NODE_20834_length_779_cov_1.364706_2_plen_22_part_01